MSVNEDLITSEVNNTLSEPISDDNKIQKISKFCYSLQNKQKKIIKEPQFDDDGDLILDNEDEEIIEIEHKIQTNLSEVGFQLWRGAFFMADFAIHHSEIFQNKTILEIGAGTGITSIVISKHCHPKKVIVTDLDFLHDTLKNNLKRNNSTAYAQVLDLNNYEKTTISSELPSVEIVIGADIIYDNNITDSLFNFMKTFQNSSKRNKIFYFTIDKRYVFTLDDLDTVAPAYEYFMAKLEKFAENSQEISINESYPNEIRQAFCYERSKDLVLLSIHVKPK